MTSAFPTFGFGDFDVYSLLLVILFLLALVLFILTIGDSLHIFLSSEGCKEGFDFENEKVEIKTKSSRVTNENEEPQAIGSIPLFVKRIREGFKISHNNFRVMFVVVAGTAIIQLIRHIKSKLSNSSLVSKDIKPDQTLAPLLRLTEETTYPLQNMTTYINETLPKVKLTYQVLNEGQGETMTIYRQGCFQYKEVGSVEDISFQGSPTELAIILGPGFEEAMLEAIIGMKSNGRRIISIPREVSGLEKNILLELKLTSIRDLNLRSRI